MEEEHADNRLRKLQYLIGRLRIYEIKAVTAPGQFKAVLDLIDENLDIAIFIATAARRSNPAGQLTIPAAIRTQFESLHDADELAAAAQAYTVTTTWFTDTAELLRAALALRALLEKTTDTLPVAKTLTRAYGVVTAQLADPSELLQGATALRARLKKTTDADFATVLAETYGVIAPRIADAAELQAGAAALREQFKSTSTHAASLEQSSSRRLFLKYESADALLEAYAATTTQLAIVNPSALQDEAATLRTQLADPSQHDLAPALANVYAAAVRAVSNPIELNAGAAALRAEIEKTADSCVAPFANAYAAAVEKLLPDATGNASLPVLRSILWLASHPFLENKRALLNTLEPFSKIRFDDDWNAAFTWAHERYGVGVDTLTERTSPAEIDFYSSANRSGCGISVDYF